MKDVDWSHFLIIFGIVYLLVQLCLAVFTDYTKHNWEKKQFMLGMLPKDNPKSYRRAYIAMVSFALALCIFLEILVIITPAG